MTTAEQMPPLPRPAALDDHRIAPTAGQYSATQVHAYARAYAAQEVAREREACAKVCESLFDADDDTCDEAEKCAAAIRARNA